MEFNFDFLKKEGKALKDFANTDIEDEEERSTAESIKAAIEKEQEILKTESMEDTEETESIEKILSEESAKKETEYKEKDLEDKLKDIEKVISTFGSQKSLGSTKDPFRGTSFSLNKPIDFSTQVAKNYIAPYLQQPTSQDDRIKLLFESLKKQNLI